MRMLDCAIDIRIDHDGKLYDDACKISHCFDRCESGKGAVPD